jgi:quercetin dioxygenase-like cupin family protein
MIVPITGGEAVRRQPAGEIGLLVAREEVTITHARYEPGEQIAGPHVHREHTDAFYVLEGELTFEIGREAETVAVSTLGFVAMPPGVAHSFRTGGDRPSRWLTVHAPDGGFAAFMRGIRDGVPVAWDISPAPSDGGLPAGAAIVSPDRGGRGEPGSAPRVRCAFPHICAVEWTLGGPQALPSSRRGPRVDSVVVLAGEVEATLAGTRRTAGPGTLISAAGDTEPALELRGRGRVLGLHTPGAGLADSLRRASG